VARLDPMKDHANLINAAAIFAKTNPDTRFVCVGTGRPDYRAGLLEAAKSLGLSDRVVWTGELGDVKAAYNAFDFATLPSAFGEGFPNVIGEAMACGTPVVATDIGDARAIIGELGEVVAPGEPALLAAGWARLRQRLARNPRLRETTREAIVANYGLDTMVHRSEVILAQLVEGRPAAEVAREFA
jgi:glycosyltransferase involved in cell wall biosynthesis